MNKEIIFWIDSETTGFDKDKNQMVSFAIVATDIHFNIVDQYYSLIKYNGVAIVTEQAMSVNKIKLDSPEHNAVAVLEKQIAADVEAFFNKNKTPKSLLIAQNAPFDKGFLFSTIARAAVRNVLENEKFVCTVSFFKKLVAMGLIQTRVILDKNGKPYSSSKLEHIAEALGLTHNAHNALGDTLVLIESYKRGIKLLNNQDFFEIYE